MTLPDINKTYPQLEEALFCNCTYCATEIFIGEALVIYDGLNYCDRICMATELVRNGDAKQVFAGE